MVDVVGKATRSRMMSGIQSKNTKPEIVVRKLLHSHGYRFRLHSKDLPGKPDLVLRKFNAVIFINGCFWHGHDCHLFKLPATRQDFWREKICKNQQCDSRVQRSLLELSWRVMTIWECALRGREKQSHNSLSNLACDWLNSTRPTLVVRGV